MRWLPLLGLSGCWLTDAEISAKWDDADTDVDTVVEGETTEIRSIDPAFGTDAGGVRVVIEVDAIGADPSVSFGGVDARILSADGETLIVETPPGSAGPVDVEVASGGASAVAPGGFWYWPDGEGRFGAIGAVYWNDYVGALANLGYVDTGFAWFQLVEPSDRGYDALFGTGMDRCVNDTFEPLDPGYVPIDLGVTDVRIQPETGAAISLPFDTDLDAYGVELGPEEYVASGTYRLLAPDGDVPWPPFAIDPVAVTPPAFEILAPDLEAVNDDASIGEWVGRSFTLAWTTDETADYVVVRLVRWGPSLSGSVPVESARCLLEDDGSFTIPATLFDGWSPFYPLDLYVGRVKLTGTTLPHNRAMNGVTGQYRIAGTVYQVGF